MKTAYSIFQTMTIQPLQSLILTALDKMLVEGGYGKKDIYFDQLTPLVILTDTADDTDESVEEAQEDVNDSMRNEETTEELEKEKEENIRRFSDFGFNRAYSDISDETK